MRKFYHLLNNFSAGEVSPKLYGRTDLNQYRHGAETISNFIPVAYGGLERRLGTEYIAPVKDSSKKTRLIPFIYSNTISYILELGDLYMRFYYQGAQVTSGGSPVEVTTPWTEADLSGIQVAEKEGIIYFTHPDYSLRKLVRNSSTSFTLSEVTLSDGPYYDIKHSLYGGLGSGTTLTVSAASGTGVTVTSSASLFVSTDVGRLIRVRQAATDTWANLTITTYTNATTVTADYNSSTTTIPSATNLWMLGALSETTGYGRTIVFHEQRLVLGGTTDQSQTLFFSVAGEPTNFAPDDATATAVITDSSAMTLKVEASETYTIQWLASMQSLLIGTTGYVFSAKASSLGEALTPSNVNARPETKTACYFKRPIVLGTTVIFLDFYRIGLQALNYQFYTNLYLVNDLALLSAHIMETSPLKEIAYEYSPNSVIWGCLEDGKIITNTYIQDQNVNAWAVHTIAGSYGSGHAVAESITTLPGTDQVETWMVVKRTINGSTVKYIERIPRNFVITVNKEDGIFLDSYKTIDNSVSIEGLAESSGDIQLTVTGHGWSVGDKVYIKNNSTTITSGSPTTINRIWTIDSIVDVNNVTLKGTSVTLSNISTDGTVCKLITSISGLDHLEGESVTPFVDGAVQPESIVTGGAITLSTSGAKIIIGLNYTSEFKSLPLDSPSTMGTPIGTPQTIYRSIIRFYRTLGGMVGRDSVNKHEVLYRIGNDPMNESPPLFSGMKEIQFPGKWDLSTQIYIVQDQPLPMYITMIVNIYLVGEQ